MEDSIVTTESNKFPVTDPVGGISVKSLEGRVKSKVSDGAKSLSCSLKIAFSITDCNKQDLETNRRGARPCEDPGDPPPEEQRQPRVRLDPRGARRAD